MMSYPNATTTIMRSVLSEKTEYIADSSTNTHEIQLDNQQSRSSFDGPVGIFWDIENCPVPSSVRPEDVGVNIRMAVTVHPVIRGAVTMFNAYGDFTYITKRVREGCQRTGVKLVDVPNGRKDAADKAILVDMFLFALDNSAPSTIMLISGDVDFAPALHILGQRGYTVILVIPQGSVSSALCNAGKFLWDWPSVAHGEGFVPPARALIPHRVGPSEVGPSYLMGCQVSDESFQNEEDHIVYGLSQSYHSSRDWSVMPCSVSVHNNSSSTPFYPCDQSSDFGSCVPPRDLNVLKGQLVKLLEISGGGLYLNRVLAEYLRLYGKPLFISDFGVFELANLFKKMGDMMTVMGKGKKQFVYLAQKRMCPSAPPLILARNGRCKGKATQEEVIMGNNASSDELSDEGRASAVGADHLGASNNDEMLEHFKYELLEIMVSYSCQIFLDLFEDLYQQRYKKPLDYRRFGVVCVEELFKKFGDVVAIRQDPGSEKFFLCPVGRG